MEEHPYLIVYRTKMYRIGTRVFQAAIMVQPGELGFAAVLQSLVPGIATLFENPMLEAMAESNSFDGLVLVVSDWIETIKSRGGVEF